METSKIRITLEEQEDGTWTAISDLGKFGVQIGENPIETLKNFITALEQEQSPIEEELDEETEAEAEVEEEEQRGPFKAKHPWFG